MQKFTTFKGKAVVLDMSDVDTDQILPRQFLKLIDRCDFGGFLFHHHRFNHRGELNPDFPLNRRDAKRPTILLTGPNFGCGSSREHAAWALWDYGIRVLIGPGFADIFKGNCFKIGLLPIELSVGAVDELSDMVGVYENSPIHVNLERQMIYGPFKFRCAFEVDPFQKRRLLEGLDDITATLQYESQIRSYEATHTVPWRAAVHGNEPSIDRTSLPFGSAQAREERP